MAGALNGAADRARTVLGGFTTGQKVVTVLAVLGLVIGGYMFSTWAAKPTYAPLYNNLPGQDASAIVEKLEGTGTPYQLADGGGTILVPKDDVYSTRVQMSGAGLPNGDASGYALLDKEGITASDFRQHVAYQRALEGELAKTIGVIDGIKAAVVHLAIPEKNVFAEEGKSAGASVLIDTEPGQKLSAQQVQSIVHLVASSVEDLPVEAVAVTDSSGRMLSRPGEAGSLDAAGDTRSAQEREYAEQLERKTQEMIDRVVGPGHSVVRISADLDFDQRNTTSEKYDPAKDAPEVATSKSTETYNGAGNPVGGVLGAGTVGGGTGGATKYDKSTETKNRAVGKTVEQVKNTPGAVKRLTVAVLLDRRTATSADTDTVTSLVSNAVGLDAERGDEIEVGQMPFETTTADQARKELDAAQKAAGRAETMSMARTGGAVFVVCLVLVFTWLSARRRRKHAAVDIDPAEMAELRRTVARQIADEQRLLEAPSAAIGELEAGSGGGDSDGEAQRLALVHKEIADMVERQPDEVAALLRGWLADRRS